MGFLSLFAATVLTGLVDRINGNVFIWFHQSVDKEIRAFTEDLVRHR